MSGGKSQFEFKFRMPECRPKVGLFFASLAYVLCMCSWVVDAWLPSSSPPLSLCFLRYVVTVR